MKKKFFTSTRGQYSIIGFLIIVLTLIVYLFNFTDKINEIYKKLFSNEPLPLLIRHEWMFQEPIIPISESAISWEPLIQITNISEKPITLFDIKIEFEPKKKKGDTWKIIQKDDQYSKIIKIWEDIEAPSWEIFGKDTLPKCKEIELPVRFNPGQRKYLLFPLEYKIIINDKKAIFNDLNIFRKSIAWIVGAETNDDGVYNCFFNKDLSVKIIISDQGKFVNPVVNFHLNVDGCYSIFPIFENKDNKK